MGKPIPEGYVSTEGYAALHNRSPNYISCLCKAGKLKTAIKINRDWWIMQDEPDTPDGYITLKQYAEKHGRSHIRISQLRRDGKLTTAMKKGNRVYVREDEPYPDKYGAPPRRIDDSYVTTGEYARSRDMLPSSVARACRDGKLKSAVYSHGKWWIDPEEEYPQPKRYHVKNVPSVVVCTRTCRRCGAKFEGYPRSHYCDRCREEKRREYDRKKHNRRLGEIDYCVNCGKEYVIVGSLQKYCKECAPEMIRQRDREQGLAWYDQNKEKLNAARREKRRAEKEKSE